MQKSFVLQDLLRRPEVAVVVNLQLENTSWTASRLAHFLSTPNPDTRVKEGAATTWLDLYQDFNSTISLLAQLTEVTKVCSNHAKNMWYHHSISLSCD